MVECPLGLRLASNGEIQKAGSGEAVTVQEAVNKSDIVAIQLEQKEQNRRLTLLEGRINWIFTTVIAGLVVGFVNLAVYMLGLLGQRGVL